MLRARSQEFRTRQVKEIRVLMKGVKNGTRTIFDFGCCYDGNGIGRKSSSELGSAIRIFECSNTGSY